MTSPIPRRVLLSIVLGATAGCVQPGSYHRAVAFSPAAADTTVDTYEQQVIRVLEARGYGVVVETPGARLRAERAHPDSARDVVSVRRTAEPYSADGYTIRFAFRISARSLDPSGRVGGPAPETRADVDSLVTELAMLRGQGKPSWVNRLSCAMSAATDADFVVGIDNRVQQGRSSPGLQLASRHRPDDPVATPFNRQSVPGLTITPDDGDGLHVEMWPGSGNDVVELRDRILERCRGRIVQPRPTDASDSD